MRFENWRGVALGALMAATALTPALAQDAQAGTDEEDFSNPPVLGQSSVQPKGTLFQVPVPDTAPAHAGRERVLDLKIAYTEGLIRNPAAGRPDRVKLRSYQGTDVDPNHPFVAPTIQATPGDTVRIRLDNQLPPDPSCLHSDAPTNTPHCFNGTNLHSHGLWVSPTGNSDNVLLAINPGVKFEYEYNIPADHPAGTFWYHPHRHGSTALQVGSGMAGALIIRGDRPPTEVSNGDLDTLVKPFPERLLVFEQIPYACLKDGKLKTKADGSIDWSCAPGEVGEVISYDQFTPSSWKDSGRFTTINGRVRPIFANAQVGKAERWRLVHAGVRDTINVQFRKMDPKDFLKREKKLAAGDENAFVEDLCTGSPVPYIVAASDGLTMASGQVRSDLTLQPGYRNDLLVTFPEDGFYCVVKPPVKAADGVTRVDRSRAILGFVRVKNAQKAVTSAALGGPVEQTVQQLIDNANATYTPAIAKQVVTDLKDGIKLTKFVPHKPITDEEVAGQPKQDLVFFINLGPNANGPTKFQVGKQFGIEQSDNGVYGPQGARAYDPNVVDRKLVLGTAQEWELRSYFVSHPFHIHVNPFEIIKILDPEGRDVSLPGARERDGTESQYAGLKGVWKDTLWVKSDNSDPLTSTANPPKGTYQIFIRTRYERYIGEFVLHCHILDHEDQGMMQNVSIGVPDGSGGVAHAHEHGTH